MSPFDQVAEALERRRALHLDGRSNDQPRLLARCPAHHDDRPSLAVREGEDGRCLLACSAGCEAERVIKALGIAWSDLFGHDATPGDAYSCGEATTDTEPGSGNGGRRARLHKASTIQSERVRWAWRGRIPRGRYAGREGRGVTDIQSVGQLAFSPRRAGRCA